MKDFDLSKLPPDWAPADANDHLESYCAAVRLEMQAIKVAAVDFQEDWVGSELGSVNSPGIEFDAQLAGGYLMHIDIISLVVLAIVYCAWAPSLRGSRK